MAYKISGSLADPDQTFDTFEEMYGRLTGGQVGDPNVDDKITVGESTPLSRHHLHKALTTTPSREIAIYRTPPDGTQRFDCVVAQV